MTAEIVCRSCRSTNLYPVLSLGRTPLANALLTESELDQPEATYPLDLVFCLQCSLVQITETVSPELLFRDYLYFSSFSDTMLEHARALTKHLIEYRALGSDSLAVEIASNDGYLLQYYNGAKIPVLGIEPARNIAAVANDRGISTISEFFNQDLAIELVKRGYQADVLHAHNVLAHVADLNGVVAGIHTILKPDGIAVIEVPYVKDLIDHVEFDTVYHEHLCYFSLSALIQLFNQHGLKVVDVWRVAIHGGSLRLYVARSGEMSPAVKVLLQEEEEWGVWTAAYYSSFGERVSALRHSLNSVLADLKTAGSRIAAYGASAKGSTLLNYCGIGKATIEYVVDRSTAKQGRFTPGTHLPIHSPDILETRRPDYLLLLAWNFAEEILLQQATFRGLGGRFIIPVPNVSVV